MTSDSGHTKLNYFVMHFHANDLVWDASNQLLYFAIAANSASMPNTVVAVDPATGTITSKLVMDSEPRRLAVSDNGQYLYVGLNGGSIARVLTPQLTSDIKIPLDPTAIVVQLAAAPHAPRTVAAAVYNLQPPFGLPGLAVFDDAVRRPDILVGQFLWGNAYRNADIEGFAWKPDGSTIYANGLWTIAVDSQGVRLQDVKPYRVNFTPTYADGLLYMTDGYVYDIDKDIVTGRFGDYGGDVPRAELLNQGKTFALHGHSKSGSEPPAQDGSVIASFEPTTFTLLDTIAFVGSTLGPDGARMISWGTSGLAFASEEAVIAWGSFAETESRIATAPPSSTSSGTLQGSLGSVSYAVFDLGANDIIADTCRGKFYVATTGVAQYGPAPYAPNSVVAVEPWSGPSHEAVFTGSEPAALAISDDCAYVYAAPKYSNSIQRLTTGPLTADLLIPLQVTDGLGYARQIDVAPGEPRTIVAALSEFSGISYCDSSSYSARIYDDAAPRDNTLGPDVYAPYQLSWGDTATTIYGVDTLPIVDTPSGWSSVLSAWSIDNAGFGSRATVLAPPSLGLYYHYDRVTGRLFDSYRNFVATRTPTPAAQTIQASWTTVQESGCGTPWQAMTTDASGAVQFAYETQASDGGYNLNMDVYEPTALAVANHWVLAEAGIPWRVATLPGSIAVVTRSGSVVIFTGAVNH